MLLALDINTDIDEDAFLEKHPAAPRQNAHTSIQLQGKQLGRIEHRTAMRKARCAPEFLAERKGEFAELESKIIDRVDKLLTCRSDTTHSGLIDAFKIFVGCFTHPVENG